MYEHEVVKKKKKKRLTNNQTFYLFIFFLAFSFIGISVQFNNIFLRHIFANAFMMYYVRMVNQLNIKTNK